MHVAGAVLHVLTGFGLQFAAPSAVAEGAALFFGVNSRYPMKNRGLGKNDHLSAFSHQKRHPFPLAVFKRFHASLSHDSGVF
jgi:hypothetical protein